MLCVDLGDTYLRYFYISTVILCIMNLFFNKLIFFFIFTFSFFKFFSNTTTEPPSKNNQIHQQLLQSSLSSLREFHLRRTRVTRNITSVPALLYFHCRTTSEHTKSATILISIKKLQNNHQLWPTTPLVRTFFFFLVKLSIRLTSSSVNSPFLIISNAFRFSFYFYINSHFWGKEKR